MKDQRRRRHDVIELCERVAEVQRPAQRAVSDFTALGISSGAGNPGGPGFTTTAAENPLVTRFRVSADGRSTPPSKPLIVNFEP